jgi:hypothetical protein
MAAPSRTRLSVVRVLVFVGSAFVVAAFLKGLFGLLPTIGPVFVGLLVASLVVYRWHRRTKLVRMLRRGEVNEIIAEWSDRFDTLPHSETLAPLLTATAFAAYGRVDDARSALAKAARGPAWDAALEHRLFLDVILSTFEGQGDAALTSSAHLSTLPVPHASHLRDRVTSMREASAALARAFAHRARSGDLDLLERASETSPLVFWAMRYAAAVVAIDEGKLSRAADLVAGAPNWPEVSAFRSFHDEIEGEIGTRIEASRPSGN